MDLPRYRRWRRVGACVPVVVVAASLIGALSFSPVDAFTLPSTPFALVMMDFTSSTSGVGVFTYENQTGSHCEDVVAPTENARSFDAARLVTTWDCNTVIAPVTQITFDGHGDGFLYDPELFVTHDHGATWARSPVRGRVIAIEAEGSSLWLVATSCASNLDTVIARCPLRLLESNDGGRTWARAPALPAGATASSGLDGANGQTFLVRRSARVAYLLVAPRTNYSGRADAAPLWLTTNAGATWSPRSVPCGFDAMSAVLASSPGGRLLAVCAGQPSAGFQPKSTVTSADEGRTWTVLNACRDPASSTGCSSNLNSGYLGGITALSHQVAFEYGDRSVLQITRDGGHTWSAVQPTIGAAGGTSQVVFADRTHGFVITGYDRYLWRTSDGGRHWFTTRVSLH